MKHAERSGFFPSDANYWKVSVCDFRHRQRRARSSRSLVAYDVTIRSSVTYPDASRKRLWMNFEGTSVPVLMVFVDYDNVESSHTRAGPVSLAKMLVALTPPSVLALHSSITVRLYGGWRSQSTLTTTAQRLIPVIRATSPCIVSSAHAGGTMSLRLTVELADKPIGASIPLEQTLARDRGLRKFRTLPTPWSECMDSGSCGLSNLAGLTYNSSCGKSGCATKLGDIFVRDEQKMVDTLIVADIAHQAFVARATNIVVVSSDTDMWPGVLLALRAGCSVSHIHTTHDWRTQRHLMNTMDAQLSRIYQQLSV